MTALARDVGWHPARPPRPPCGDPATPCRAPRSGPCRSCGTTSTSPTCGTAPTRLTILDEIARTGYEGTQLGIGFPEGEALRDALAERHLRLAEVYLSIPATVDGPTPDALAIGRERLRLLHDGGGEVLVIALDLSPGREERAGRASEPGTPVLTDAGWDALLDDRPRPRGRGRRGRPSGGLPSPRRDVHRDAGRGRAAGRRVSIPTLVGICLDVGHYIGRRRRPGRGAARPRRSGDPHPPQGRRSGRPRRTAQRGDRWLRCRDPGAALHRARGGCARPRRRPRRRWPAATTTAG